MASEISRANRGHFNILHIATGSKADLYPSHNHPYNRWAWENRRLVPLGNVEVYFAPPEYLILWKLYFLREGGSDKHIRDIRGMLSMSRDVIDLTFLNKTTTELGLTPSWNMVSTTDT